MHHELLVERKRRGSSTLRTALVLGLACAALAPVLSRAAQVTFRWDYTESGAAGFILYCGLASGRYTAIVDIGNTDTYTIAGLSQGQTYQCAVTAYDATRVQSNYSDPVVFYIANTGKCSRGCQGDLNQDGGVNALDLSALKRSYGTNDPDADLNGDGVVNAIDLGIFRNLFQ